MEWFGCQLDIKTQRAMWYGFIEKNKKRLGGGSSDAQKKKKDKTKYFDEIIEIYFNKMNM